MDVNPEVWFLQFQVEEQRSAAVQLEKRIETMYQDHLLI